MRRLLATAVVAGLVIGLPACGKTNEASRAAGIVPVDALAYVSVTLKPSLVQMKDLFELAQKFPNARKLVNGNFDISRDNLLQQAVKSACLDFQRDVKPWLGSELAVAVLPPLSGGKVPAPVLLIKVNDQTKAKAALDKAAAHTCAGSATSAAHAPRYRLVKDFAVVVNEAKTTDDALILDRFDRQAQKNDGGLANTAGFANVVNKLANDRLAVGWVDTKAVGKLVTQSAKSATTALGGLNLTGVGNCDLASLGLGNSANATHLAFDLRATPSSVMVEGLADGTVTKAPGGQPKLTEGLPGDTMAAGTVFDIGAIVRGVLSCTGMAAKSTDSFNRATGLNLDADVLSLLGGETVLVTGPAPAGSRLPGIGLVTAISDHAKAVTAVDHLVAALRQRNVTLTETTVAGVKAYRIDLFNPTAASAAASASASAATATASAGGSDSQARPGWLRPFPGGHQSRHHSPHRTAERAQAHLRPARRPAGAGHHALLSGRVGHHGVVLVGLRR